MHGELDQIIPVKNGELVMQQLTAAARKELVVMPGQGSWSIVLRSPAAATVALPLPPRGHLVYAPKRPVSFCGIGRGE